MINVTIFTDSAKEYVGFNITGLAGYSEAGTDIICSAVSVLSLNTVNSIERFTDDAFEASVDEESGDLILKLTDKVCAESKLLIDSMILGLNEIRNEYGKEFLEISYKEV